MTDVNQLITEHLDVWTSATESKSSAGRGNGGAVSLYGIKTLRRLILELAVRGKLVGQDPTDASAESLLDKKNQYANRGKRPFEVPSNWVWAPLGAISKMVYGKNLPTKELLHEGFPVFGANGIIGAYDRYLYDDPMVLISCRGAYSGKANISPPQCYVTNNSLVLGQFEQPAFVEEYLFYALEGLPKEGLVTGSAQPQVTIANANPFFVPLPPIAEQHRIVTKVDELMRLCDALETQAEDSIKAHQTLVETCLTTVTNSLTSEALIQNWTRVEAHFDTLFTTEESVAALRNAMLDLALRGLLTEQKKGDEPASVLLSELYKNNKKIASSRHRTIVSKTKESQSPFDLPESWAWSNLGLLSSDLRYGTSKKCDRDDNLVPVLRIPNVSGGKVDLADMKFGPLDEKEVADLGLRANDLLIIRSNGSLDIVGSFAVVPELEGDFAFAGYLVRVRIDPAYVDPRYIWYVSRSRFLRGQIEGPIRHGVGLKNVNSTELASLKFPIPPKAEQDRIIRKLDSLFELCDQFSQRVVDLNSVTVTLADTLTSKIH